MAKLTKAELADYYLTNGMVAVTGVQKDGHGVKAEVTGESGNVHKAAAWYEGKTLVRYCDCDYSTKYHENKKDCSHALAVQKLVKKP